MMVAPTTISCATLILEGRGIRKNIMFSHGGLHSTGTSRQLVRSVAGRGREEGMQDDFGRSEGGKLIIRVRITSPDLTPAQVSHV